LRVDLLPENAPELICFIKELKEFLLPDALEESLGMLTVELWLFAEARGGLLLGLEDKEGCESDNIAETAVVVVGTELSGVLLSFLDFLFLAFSFS
jgi:hypothetical protein